MSTDKKTTTRSRNRVLDDKIREVLAEIPDVVAKHGSNLDRIATRYDINREEAAIRVFKFGLLLLVKEAVEQDIEAIFGRKGRGKG